MAEHLMFVVEFDPEHGVGEGLGDLALHLDLLLFAHAAESVYDGMVPRGAACGRGRRPPRGCRLRRRTAPPRARRAAPPLRDPPRCPIRQPVRVPATAAAAGHRVARPAPQPTFRGPG